MSTTNEIEVSSRIGYEAGELILTYRRSPVPEIVISGPTSAVQFLRKIWAPDMEYRERFYELVLDSNCRLLGWYEVSSGALNCTLVDPRIIFSLALRAPARQIIVAHNHPNGDTRPSKPDLNLTKRLIEGAAILGMVLHDHLILTPGGEYLSMRDEQYISVPKKTG